MDHHAESAVTVRTTSPAASPVIFGRKSHRECTDSVGVAWTHFEAVPITDRRIALARQLLDDDVVAGHRYGAASKRPNFRQHLERRSESGDLREDLLGSTDHLSVLDVVSGLMPRADQSAIVIGTSSRSRKNSDANSTSV